MHRKLCKTQPVCLLLMFLLQVAQVAAYKGNYEAKYTKANVPIWKQRACEKSQKYKANSHYVCDDKGDVKCLPGWQGDLCQVPMCRRGCDPMNGYCQRPGECRCRIGFTGELCDKCIPLPGCQHGECTKPFECICRPGWDGLFCTEPTCRPGCHNTRGYCEAPGECRCRIGWAGRNCSDCSVLPGCQHGTCSKPLECQCLSGYTGLLCQTPICHADCHKQHGWCKKPGECRCKVGWTGVNCDKCFPYPGCKNGDCERPWECNCRPGWGGLLCDEELTYCKEHADICENKGKCISLTKEDGSYRCLCKQGYLGKNCEIVDEFLLTSTAAPRITPPPPVDWSKQEEENADLSLENELHSSLEGQGNEGHKFNLNKNLTLAEKTDLDSLTAIHSTATQTYENITRPTNNTRLVNVTAAQKQASKPNEVQKPKQEEISLNGTNDSLKENLELINTTLAHLNATNASLEALSALNNTNFGSKFASLKNTLSPLNKLNDEQHLLGVALKPTDSDKKTEKEAENEEDDDECTDENDDECEYVDEEDDDF